MVVRSARLLAYAMGPAIAVAFAGNATALGDLVPISRTSTVSASWSYSSSPVFQNGSESDGTATFDYFSRSLTSGNGAASQTSYLLPNGAYAVVSATGVDNGSPMHHSGSSGASAFNYVFQLTTPTTLYISGTLSRNDAPFPIGFGIVRIYNDVTNQIVYERSGSPTSAMTLNFSDTYLATAGRYRFAVTASNSGNGAMPGSLTYTSGATAMLTTPTPGSASLLLLGGLAAARRRRG
ncbi:MAG: hypothetical protein QM783_14680 [Phycisphaerales bacterium]